MKSFPTPSLPAAPPRRGAQRPASPPPANQTLLDAGPGRLCEAAPRCRHPPPSEFNPFQRPFPPRVLPLPAARTHRPRLMTFPHLHYYRVHTPGRVRRPRRGGRGSYTLNIPTDSPSRPPASPPVLLLSSPFRPGTHRPLGLLPSSSAPGRVRRPGLGRGSRRLRGLLRHRGDGIRRSVWPDRHQNGPGPPGAWSGRISAN